MLPAPTNLRDTVLLFGRLRMDQGAEDLFAQVDWSGATRRQLVHAFLDRAPASAAEAADPPDGDMRAVASELFASSDFRKNLGPRLLSHFAERRRLLFVHLPKAAGSDFTTAMRRAFPAVGHDLSEPDLVPLPMLTRRLRHLSRTLDKTDTIFMGGHIPLSRFLDDGSYRFQDRLVAIVRDPHEICVSFANYVLKRFSQCEDLSAPDTRSWAHALNMTSGEIAAIEPRTLALALVTRPGFRPTNPICSLLGDGTARGTLDTLRRAPVEITSVSRYTDWLKQEWAISREERVNTSPQLIGWNDLSGWQKSEIEASCAQDRIVYGAVMACLARAGTLSVTGPQVAHMVDS